MENEMKRYIRTQDGSFWELTKNNAYMPINCYRKPGCATILYGDESCIVISADDIIDLIQPGDLIKNSEERAESVNKGKKFQFTFNEVYTQSKPGANYVLVAVKHNGNWIIQ